MSKIMTKRSVREILVEFINIYRSEPCLWRMKSKDYHDRKKKTAAYGKLIKQYQKLEPDANRDVIVKKLNSLRSNYRKEKKKVEESMRYTAGSSDDVYVPTLWYYDLLTFLNEDQGARKDEICSNVEENDSSRETELILDRDCSDTASTSEHTSSRPRPRKRKTTGSIELSNEVFCSVNDHFDPLLKDDRFDIFGKNVAMKLRDLPREQRLIAEKIINDTLFQAEMGNLTLPERESSPWCLKSEMH